MEQQEEEGNADFAFSVDEEGFVLLTTTLEDGSELELVLGEKQAVCEEMCRFLAEVDFGECA